VLIRLTLPNGAPAVELVIGQPQYSQPSITSPPCVKQRGRLCETNVHSILASLSVPLKLYELLPVTV